MAFQPHNLVKNAIRPLSFWLGVLYVILTLSHWLILPRDVAPIMMGIAGGSALSLFTLYWYSGQKTFTRASVYPVGTFIAGVVGVNSFVHMLLDPHPHLSTNIGLLIIGLGVFMIDRNWYLGNLMVALIGYGIVLGILGYSDSWTPFLFFILQATILSVIANYVRTQNAINLANRQQEIELVAQFAIENEDRFRTLADATFEGIVIHQNGFILDANPAFATLFDYEIYEMIGMSVYDLVAPEDRETAIANARSGSEQMYEIAAQKRDGQRFIIEVRGRMVQRETGPIRVVAVRDVTEQREYERELRREALIFENISDSVILTDLSGKIIDINPATVRLFGYEREELIGKTPAEMWHVPRTGVSVNEQIIQGIHQNGRWQGEIEVVRRDKVHRVMDVTALPLVDSDGSRIATIGVSQDITDRKAAEQAMKQAKEAAEDANKAKTNFLASMSHELRTPLNAVIGYTELIIEEARHNKLETVEVDAIKISSASRHLLGIINDILDIARIEAGRVHLSLTSFSIAYLVDDVRAAVEPLIAKNGNIFIMEIADDVKKLYGDELRVRQMLVNLLGNAAKFTHSGTVSLNIHSANRGINFVVSDTGIGIKEDELERLFEAFTQSEENSTRTYGGTGLGLAITRRLCDIMGGSISVQSEVGKGSTFTLWLPDIAQIPDELTEVVEHN
ncbi:MAG: PAS domain S-box protein [Chloroflexi bacterium]|nr:PAS domain S-box protein [Chloroflexota bacterium]